MNRSNFFIGLLLGAIGGWLGDVYFGRNKLEGQLASLRSERVTVQGQLKNAERVVTSQSAEIAKLTSELSAAVSKPAPVKPTPTPVAATTGEKNSSPDNLRLIEGIGPKAFGVLTDAGVTSFARMATMDAQALMDILKAARLRGKFYTDSWPAQAAVAATGDMKALTQLQNELVGGRRVS